MCPFICMKTINQETEAGLHTVVESSDLSSNYLIELSVFRIHFGQITSNQMLLSVMDELRTNTLSRVCQIRVSNVWKGQQTDVSRTCFLWGFSVCFLCLRMWWASTAPPWSSSSERLKAKRMWRSLLTPRANWRKRRRRGGNERELFWPLLEQYKLL